MRCKLAVAALAVTVLAGMTVATAIAGERETVGNVTILRGTSPNEENLANSPNVPMTGSSLPQVSGVYTVDVNGHFKQLSIGSSIPPGWIAIPSTAAGQ